MNSNREGLRELASNSDSNQRPLQLDLLRLSRILEKCSASLKRSSSLASSKSISLTTSIASFNGFSRPIPKEVR